MRELRNHTVVGLLSALLIISVSCFAAEEGPFAITHGPCLQSPGTTEVTVTWHTNRAGVSRVVYHEGNGPEQTAVTSKAGLIPNDSTCHAVCLSGLKPGATYKYRVVTREFIKYKTPYKVEFGETVESAPLTFTTLTSDKNSYSFVMWNDVHDNSKRLQAMFNDISWSGVDFVVLNGDILNDFVTPEQPFRGFYDAIVSQFAKTTPMVFVRGNHETRGPVARRMADFFPGQGGRYYWSFDHGPAHFVVLDSGEDKPDTNEEYAGLVDFARYRVEQTEWLRADLASEAARRAKFRIVLSHQPSAFGEWDHFGVQEIRRLWDPIINEANVQLWLSGHLHNFVQRAPREGGDNTYHAIMNPQEGTTRVDVSPEELKVTVIGLGGKILSTLNIK